MADFRIENPKTTEEFIAALAAANVKFPLIFSETDLGSILDADGRDVITIDVNRERPDDEVMQIAAYLIMAINTCGGYKAVAAVAHSVEIKANGNG